MYLIKMYDNKRHTHKVLLVTDVELGKIMSNLTKDYRVRDIQVIETNTDIKIVMEDLIDDSKEADLELGKLHQGRD